MGKAQKFPSKALPSVPDYQHVVETTGESEGFGSCGRADSEDSSAPKRKCISLNVDKYNKFDVPFQLFSLSKMSKSEKKELEIRFKRELEQLRMFKKRILSGNARAPNGVALSSSSDGYVRKQDPMGQNGSNLKSVNSGKLETTKKVPPTDTTSNSYSMLMKQCETLLRRLMNQKHGWVFNTPVDVVKLKIPDYFQVIKHPMDLGTIKTRLESGSYYSSPWDFVSDVRLTFTNAKTYNPPGNDVHIMADVMSRFFETGWKPIERKLIAADAAAKREAVTPKPVLLPKKRKTPSVSRDTILPEAKPKMTIEEKQSLSKRLESLGDMPLHIIDFLRRKSAASQTSEDEIEIELEAMSDEVLFELKNLLDEYLGGRTRNHAKIEPCEVEILNESGLSNSSMHPYKGNEPAEEDVDIIGNDPPVSSYPPVEIEKDAIIRSGKCSSSSSSSSDSSSSSSDSDSGSSSESESDVKAGSPTMKDMKKSMSSAQAWDQERSDLSNPRDGNRSSNGTNQQGLDAQPKLESVETEQSREGDNTPSERQVSPEKLYRAALLRSRFADTILKAREKTLDQCEKKDPEKIRREREELERQQREEKARLQAEAKAAEEARRQAEAEAAVQAAAEAKRKRELEREAARQALLQMEKTVEINESSLFLKDLEILRTAPGEHLPSSVGETSPDHSPEGISGFKLGGSNPLEQLGLYMKADDEEDEEVEPNGPTANDVEEGEID